LTIQVQRPKKELPWNHDRRFERTGAVIRAEKCTVAPYTDKTTGLKYMVKEVYETSFTNLKARQQLASFKNCPFLAIPVFEGVRKGRTVTVSPYFESDLFTPIIAMHTQPPEKGVWIPSLPDVLKLLFQAAQGAAALHRAGLVHADIDVQNIVVSSSGQAGVRAALIDFDSVSLRHGPSPSSGKVMYMSPERLRGKEKDHAMSDVYAFGVCLWVALTGFFPFEIARSRQCAHREIFERKGSRALLQQLTEQNVLKTSLPPKAVTLLLDRLLAPESWRVTPEKLVSSFEHAIKRVSE